jgi:hypothetical protein
MNEVSARWVTKLLSVVLKQRRVECCTEFLTLCKRQEKEAIESIVTGDETTVLYHDPLSQRESIDGVETPWFTTAKESKGHHFLGFLGNSVS